MTIPSNPGSNPGSNPAARRVRLDFGSGSIDHSNLSGAAFSDAAGDWLWVVGDESPSIDRLHRLPPSGTEALRYGEVQPFALDDLLDLPGKAKDEADLEGMAVADGWLWVVGSHGWKRKKPKDGESDAKNAERLAELSLDGNRRLLARIPIEPSDGSAPPRLVSKAADGRRACRLAGSAKSNLLTAALKDDPHLRDFMAVPGKDNGFDIEGLALIDARSDGARLLLGLRGPVLRGWSLLLELDVEADGDDLVLKALDDDGTRVRKHFLQLDGLGVRDLNFRGDDLYVLAGPTMVLDGDIRIYHWPGARPLLVANREASLFQSTLRAIATLPHGAGCNRAEALCSLPPALAPAAGVGGRPGDWLVLYDAPGADRREGENTVFGDLLGAG